MAKTKTAAEKILSALRRGPKRGLTAADVATRAQTNLNTTRSQLIEFEKASLVSVVGTASSTGGRPAKLYVIG